MKDIAGVEKAIGMLRPHWPQIEADFDRHNRRFIELASTDHDAIGRVLRAHLIIEHFMNLFLSSHYRIDELETLRLSFIQKAKLLPAQRSSASFVRPGIIQLNSIRNKFSHSLTHEIERHEISAIYEALESARKDKRLDPPVQAIEAFTPMACAFLTVTHPILQKMFEKAFADIHSSTPPNEG